MLDVLQGFLLVLAFALLARAHYRIFELEERMDPKEGRDDGR